MKTLQDKNVLFFFFISHKILSVLKNNLELNVSFYQIWSLRMNELDLPWINVDSRLPSAAQVH